jgi:hypothetical protein
VAINDSLPYSGGRVDPANPGESTPAFLYRLLSTPSKGTGATPNAWAVSRDRGSLPLSVGTMPSREKLNVSGGVANPVAKAPLTNPWHIISSVSQKLAPTGEDSFQPGDFSGTTGLLAGQKKAGDLSNEGARLLVNARNSTGLSYGAPGYVDYSGYHSINNPTAISSDSGAPEAGSIAARQAERYSRFGVAGTVTPSEENEMPMWARRQLAFAKQLQLNAPQ